ncbi:hypothetical protein KL905_001194 [Ogataea polymorpha]|uniref:TFIIS central domain-containing protein n=1 Tax=Ogataea polymorpha TaxID=460523 RepID=A0A9P8T987_9ASCO|nr:hypothetical protein KL937_004441 [Ogataea polymorpha]KAG7892790.1 hypothetical protein KL936_000964 [Ogataea polymorpha]KAG7896787.1 hypothetical protein KL908_000189 [Ogataea polymorpha]KAG7903410.1 hypothetical protein KL935_000942 [Ogataea polymorpha]KAG7911985.1 hypothetical protein KL906_000189 [Ogataea polymorpha]
MKNTFRKTKINPKRPTRLTHKDLGDDSDDVWKKKTLSQIQADRESVVDPGRLASEYECLLYESRKHNLDNYKERFRKDLIALKNQSTEFAQDLLRGDMSMKEFCRLKDSELLSKRQRTQDKQLLEKELKSKITTNLPDTINQIKNQANTVSEKWGISESAAKIDPEFEN